MASVLVVAAHPDDEVLGCGGTMARHAASGDEVHVLILAEGATSRQSRRDTAAAADELSALQAAAQQAGAILGARSVEVLGFPDNRLDAVPLLDLVKAIETKAAAVQPSIVYTHDAADANIDHRRLFDAATAAFRPLPGSTLERWLSFEVPSSTEWGTANSGFQPNWFVPIADTLPAKLAALNAYASEMRPFPHPRSLEAVEALARWRGATVGYGAAEAFRLVRGVVR